MEANSVHDNNVIERFWPELNSRVNYPAKRALISISETFDLDLSNPFIKFCFSWVAMDVTVDAAEHLVDSWNHHRVPGPSGCAPIENMNQTKRTVHLIEPLIPSVPEAVRMHEQSGENLTRISSFGEDPLIHVEHAYESRDFYFVKISQRVETFFSEIVHGNFQSVKNAIDCFYNLTMDFSLHYNSKIQRNTPFIIRSKFVFTCKNPRGSIGK